MNFKCECGLTFVDERSLVAHAQRCAAMDVLPQRRQHREIAMSEVTLASCDLDFGACCACGTAGEHCARNITTLNFEAPPGFAGWGCVQCGKPSRGAIAVLCDSCAAKNAAPRFIAGGKFLTDKIRVPLDSYPRVPFGHDDRLHPEAQS